MIKQLNNLQPRERLVVIGGAALVLVVMVYLLAWAPLVKRLDSLEQNLSSNRAFLQWVQTVAQEAEQLTKASANASKRRVNAQSLLVTVDQTAKSGRLGPAIKRIEPDGQDGVRVWLDNAVFDDMVAWIARLQRDYSVQITNVNIDEAGESGVVNARIKLEVAGA